MSKIKNNKAEQAAVAAVVDDSQKITQNETDWITLDGHTFKFKRVPAFLYSTARQNIHRLMEQSRPEIPIVRQGNREMVNDKDPQYIVAVKEWEAEYEIQTSEVNVVVMLLSGLVLKDGVPDTKLWLDDVISMMEIIGTDWTSYVESYDRLSEKVFLELVYKKFVVLAGDTALAEFMKYHQRSVAKVGGSMSSENASQMFQS